jgi:hypothetical protein
MWEWLVHGVGDSGWGFVRRGCMVWTGVVWALWMGHRCVLMCSDGCGCAVDGCGWVLIGLDGCCQVPMCSYGC